MSKSKIELILVPVVLFFVIGQIVVFVVRSNRYEGLSYRYMLSNLRRINIAIKDYTIEVSSQMPVAKDWADQIIASQSCILKGDFITPSANPEYGIFYNASFEGCDSMEMDANSVILFACREGRWNASGTKETFLKLSPAGKRSSYLVTWNSDVYSYDSETKTVTRSSDGTKIKIDDLIWENINKK
jgi:hypothetical protein